nr:putative uncharacterized protein [uncultured bacterium]
MTLAENSYRREIIVSGTTADAYRALTVDYDKWWTPSSIPIKNVGDIVTFRFGETYWTMRVIGLNPNRYVALECIEANHIDDRSTDSIRKEWEGTKLIWTIEKIDDKTRITFLHEGLAPSLECYDICELGWDHYFVNVLKQHLDKKAG